MLCLAGLVHAQSGNESLPAFPLRSEHDLDTLLSEIGNKRIVLLGESTHGTSEFYTWRAAITRRLVREKGFRIVAVEGEWADTWRLTQALQDGRTDSATLRTQLARFNRWPAWTWTNEETTGLIQWLYLFNRNRAPDDPAGIYGLDLYDFTESVHDLTGYLSVADTTTQRIARSAAACFASYADATAYARSAYRGSTLCRWQAQALWERIHSLPVTNMLGLDVRMALEQLAAVIVDGEAYFRTIRYSVSGAWNIRDRHMAATVRRLLEWHGPRSKIVVWAHNTHVGDARFTTMPVRGKLNLGQLLREQYGDGGVYIVGFGSYAGTVMAGRTWGAAAQITAMPPSRPGSWEDRLHQQGTADRLIFLRNLRSNKAWNGYFPQRAVGDIYDPKSEPYGGYVNSVIVRRYDAFIYLDETHALHPLPGADIGKGEGVEGMPDE